MAFYSESTNGKTCIKEFEQFLQKYSVKANIEHGEILKALDELNEKYGVQKVGERLMPKTSDCTNN